ncbi:uncharacterized protein RCC_07064 [Ramularia collo-cygni]|uniref:Uncharacterized protein n=1 Tax=Ramularia collo-cygni TaxID=112498 RepID=A0A2D3UUB4_9PEZI|nr:uncharacterized protein RCC_07064 [Ramularia collo-cygni]CZT21202.1 uncharacterized protein RCC_07064 [Ramularia collo-cygni]
MKQTLLSTLALATAFCSIPALAQKPGPIKLPGLGTCPDECVSIRNPAGGALLACCGTAEGCIDCAPDCIAVCNGGTGFYGSCTDLGGDVENTCTKGCETFCETEVSLSVNFVRFGGFFKRIEADAVIQDYTVCTISGQYVDPVPEGCPDPNA